MNYGGESKSDDWETKRAESAEQAAAWNPVLLRDKIKQLEAQIESLKAQLNQKDAS